MTLSGGIEDPNNEVSDSNSHEEIEGNGKGNSTSKHSQNVSQASHVSQNLAGNLAQNSYKCPYCEIIYHNSAVALDNEDALDTHVVQKHPRWNAHSQPDIEKFRQEYLRKHNGKEGLN